MIGKKTFSIFLTLSQKYFSLHNCLVKKQLVLGLNHSSNFGFTAVVSAVVQCKILQIQTITTGTEGTGYDPLTFPTWVVRPNWLKLTRMLSMRQKRFQSNNGNFNYFNKQHKLFILIGDASGHKMISHLFISWIIEPGIPGTRLPPFPPFNKTAIKSIHTCRLQVPLTNPTELRTQRLPRVTFSILFYFRSPSDC